MFNTVALISCQSAEDTGQQITTIETSQTSADSEQWTTPYDGNSADASRNFNKEELTWKVEEGLLTTFGNQGDIITKETYENFELVFEWKTEKRSKIGVIFNVQEGDDYDYTYETDPEYQLIDNEDYEEVHNYTLEPSQVTAEIYAWYVPEEHQLNPVGEFNTSPILFNEGHVEHWINGIKAVEYDLWSPEREAVVSRTRFKDMPDYGKSKSGHIALQDHGNIVWFKSTKIREL